MLSSLKIFLNISIQKKFIIFFTIILSILLIFHLSSYNNYYTSKINIFIYDDENTRGIEEKIRQELNKINDKKIKFFYEEGGRGGNDHEFYRWSYKRNAIKVVGLGIHQRLNPTRDKIGLEDLKRSKNHEKYLNNIVVNTDKNTNENHKKFKNIYSNLKNKRAHALVIHIGSINKENSELALKAVNNYYLKQSAKSFDNCANDRRIILSLDKSIFTNTYFTWNDYEKFCTQPANIVVGYVNSLGQKTNKKNIYIMVIFFLLLILMPIFLSKNYD